MITIGMLVLLTMTVISANRIMIQNTEALFAAEAITGASSIAQDLLQEAMSKKFDANSDTTGTLPVTAFDPATGLGPSPAEAAAVGAFPDSSYKKAFKSITGYSDFDDYNGYKRMATGNGISGFVIDAKVYYVSEFDPEVAVSYKTFYKVIELTVTHPLYIDSKYPIKLSGLLSY
jgi:hypothetical protein